MPRAPASIVATLLRSLSLITLVLGAGIGCNQQPRHSIIRCTPGERVDVSCGCLGLGQPCTGRAAIRLCDAALANGACTDAEAVTVSNGTDECRVDGTSTYCPRANTYCPASGMLAIHTFGATTSGSDRPSSYTCPWAVRRTSIVPGPSTTFACQAGEVVRASCGCSGLGRTCEGDPVLRACAPESACDGSVTPLAYNDDFEGCNPCPLVQASCPANNAIVIASAPLSSGASYRCEVSARGSVSGELRRMGI